jgi:DNA-binding MarR family transcriptional regulator
MCGRRIAYKSEAVPYRFTFTRSSAEFEAMSEPLEILSGTAHAIHRLGQLSEEQFARSAGPLAITARQVVVLAIADQLEGASQTNLCEISGIDRSTLADMVRRLVGRGLLDRRRTREDARRNAIRITSEGRNLLEQVLPIAHQVDRDLLQGLSPSERETFKVLLHKILSNASMVKTDRTKSVEALPSEIVAPTS